jgi:hypothetical protein
MSFCLIAAFCVAIVGMIMSFAILWTKSRRTLVTVRMDAEDEHGITRSKQRDSIRNRQAAICDDLRQRGRRSSY